MRTKGKKMHWTPDRIRNLREAYGELQTQFIIRLGVSVTTLSMWEQGHGRPNGSAQILLGRLKEDIEAGKKRPIPELQPA